MTPGEPPIYEARYGWNRQSAKVIGGCLAFCAVMLVIPAPLWARIFVVGFSGAGVIIVLVASLTRRTALRIDSSGVTLCQYPLQPRSAVFYPWDDVARLVIWQFQRLKHVGVQRRQGAAPLPGRVREYDLSR